MRRVILLALVALALPTVALADTITDFEGFGTSAAGTATLSDSLTNGGFVDTTTALTSINGASATGTITLDTGTLSGGSGVFTFTGGSLTITSGSSTLFSGTFSGGSVIATSTSILISGVLANGGGTETVTISRSGAFAVSADIGVVTTPEPGTLGLLGTGLIGIAGLVRRKIRNK
jgi:hypothetical protein